MFRTKMIATGGVASLALALVAVAPAAQAAPIGDWDFSETRATGHYERTADGLHIWTEGATSTDKVAGYLNVDLPLASTLSGGIDYAATSGITPGAQFAVDIDGNGSPDGILVGESVYGENWWLTNGSSAAFKALDPSGAEDGGNGSAHFGTLAQWSAAAPAARIVKVGFSLGSGVKGDGVVRAVVAGGTRFTFDANPPVGVAPVITKVIADGTIVGGPTTFTVDLQDDDISYTYIELNRKGTWLTDNTKAAGSQNHGLHPKLVVDLGAYPDGAYQLKINAVDATGLSANRVVPITIDNTKPVVSLVSPASGAIVGGTVAVKVTLDDANLKAYNLRVDSAGLAYSAQAANGAQPDFAWDTTTVADGEHTLLATATDAAGNKTTTTIKVTVDNSKPVVTIDAPAADSFVRGTVPVKVTLDDPNLKSYNLRVDSAGLSYAYQATNGAQPDFAWDTTTLADGVHTLLATATDTVGNKATTTIKVTVDNTRPVLAITSPADGAAFAASAGVQVDAEASDAGKLGDVVVNLYKDGVLLKSLGKQAPAGAAAWAGSWILPSGLADSTYTLKAGITDLAGNNRTITHSIVIDSTIGAEEETEEPTGEPTEPGDTTDPEEPTEPEVPATPEEPTDTGDTDEPTDGGEPAAALPTLSADASEVAPGGTVNVTGANFEAAADVEIELHSTPVELGSARADESGAIAFTATVPTSTPAGAHHIVAILPDGSTVEVPITVTAAATTTDAAGTASTAATTTAGLADTGFDGAGLGLAALATLLLGAGAMTVTSLRRRAAARG
ncbi:Ig-like domain-containing protein [Agromyces sp. Leaf222]|uniref:Ig-like domain-containing protein n=1 Tax=Agromyces sp. Leaf222 TaxID=1735688 RepID=UPI0006FD02BB|nr:Ig-like domain-containing protein [Agromyces sp. Leaf222]KQM82121.1 hypothetical protein ASE68_01415 [Agromyces sp. Leaf222]